MPINTNSFVTPKENKMVISKRIYPSKKTNLVEYGPVKQRLESKVKAKEKQKTNVQYKVPPHLKKVIEKTSKDKVNVISDVKSLPKLKELFTKDENRVTNGYLYVPSNKRGGNATPLIVVDAGHGGKAQGAKSRSGIHEKAVNLTIARHSKPRSLTQKNTHSYNKRKDTHIIPP
mgnify:CR=1 FL=1